MRQKERLPPPYRVLVVSDDDELYDDLHRHLSLRPLHVYFVEPGPAVRVLTQRADLRLLAYILGGTQRVQAPLPPTSRYEIVPAGDPRRVGVEEALKPLRDAIGRLTAEGETIGVGIVGMPAEQQLEAARFLRQSTFRVATAYSREEALDPALVGSADLVLVDSKLGEIDQWSFVLKLMERDPGDGLPVFGIVPRIDIDVLQQSVQHSVAGFLLRSLIDERLFLRLESAARSGLRKRPPDQPDNPRYVMPSATEHGLEVMPMDVVDEEQAEEDPDELEVAAARQIFHALSQKPGFEDERASSLLGATFGKTKLQRVIGRGGSGTVYLGWHQTLGTTVAVKVLFAQDVALDARFAHRFIEEARIAARIEHPNIIRVIDFDRDDESGCYYLAMEMVKGASLQQLIRKTGPLEETAILDIAERVAEVLSVAHHRGIVHRDISPANILITDRNMVKLADLGIAKVIGADSDAKSWIGDVDAADKVNMAGLTSALDGGPVPVHTVTGVLLGTPHYISPEQGRDARLVDLRCDMYSLGATLYHAATGFPPYSGLSIDAILEAHRDHPIPDPLEEHPLMSAPTAAMIQKLLAKKPDDRFGSYDELIERIRECRFQVLERQVVAGLADRGLRGWLARFVVRLLLPSFRRGRR